MRDSYISAELRQQVARRANYRCEYCLVKQDDVLLSYQLDHIIAVQHGGETVAQNLALACAHCNRHKGANIASIDPTTGQLMLLFNPRTQVWTEHFKLEGAFISPLTAVGRVTVRLLKLNYPERLRVRQALIEIGNYP